jgi:hypothetical protein
VSSLRRIGLLALLCVVFLSAHGTVPRTVAPGNELAKAWRDFMADPRGAMPVRRFPFEHCFRRAAAAYDLPLVLLLAVARGESDFQPRARSQANAHGLMQIQWPGTARHLGISRLAALYEPCTNVDAGSRYLRELLERYGGNLHLALAAYNYGPGRVRVGTKVLPQGAYWYSGYIHRHLNYVLGKGAGRASKKATMAYRDERKIDVVSFARPYRAAAFVRRMERAAPSVRLDWFRSSTERFRVVLLFRGDEELARSRRSLRRNGFVLD